eukprot:scaffold5205_cov75-Skeletonema_dohrnii-CCMP3373.AAC.2
MEQSGLFISEDANYGRLGIALGSRRHRSFVGKDQKEPLIKSRSDKVSLLSSPSISQAERVRLESGMQTDLLTRCFQTHVQGKS